MPLRYATEPQDGSGLVRAGLNRLSVRKSQLTGVVGDFGALELKPPHAIYDLQADEIVAGGGLASAHPGGFRYMIHTADGAVAAAEVHTDAAGHANLLATMNYGPFVAATEQALVQLAVNERVRADTYEVRLLRVSAIPVMAIWLKSDAGGADMIYPLAPAPGGLKAETLCSAEDFLNAIMPIAKVRVAAKGSPAVP
jgi:hypothetical protein